MTEWVCPTCGAECRAAYCAGCGERRFAAKDLTMRALFAQAVESLTNTDGRVYRSFKTLLLRPGELTRAYAEGRRKPYVGPVQLFLVANVLFFLLQSAFGFQALSNTLHSHLEDQVYSAHARELAADRFAELGTTRAAFAPIFDAAVSVNAKVLVVLLVPMFALIVWAASWGSGRAAAVHAVFALHFVAFLLLALTLVFPLVFFPLTVVFELAHVPVGWVDVMGTWLLFALCSAYAYRAFGCVYGGAVAWRVAKAVLLGFAWVPVVRLYRFAVFLITLYTA
jgi:hypothetical protein